MENIDSSDEERRQKSRKRSHHELREESEDAMSEDGAEPKELDKLGRFEHAAPVGPAGYRDDENEVQIDVEELKKHGKGKYFEEIEVEFDVRVMDEKIDYKVLTRFLATYCHKNSFNNAEFADIILSQKYLGSVIRELEDPDSYGFITVVPMSYHKDKESIKQIKRFLLANCPDSKKNKWKELLENPKLGILVNERLINVPNTIAPDLNETVYEEVDWMKEDRQPFNFDSYLYLTTYTHKDEGVDRDEDAEPRNKKHKTESKKECFKAEDEVYIKYASEMLEFSKSQTETRVAILFPASKVKQILAEIRSHVDENYNW